MSDTEMDESKDVYSDCSDTDELSDSDEETYSKQELIDVDTQIKKKYTGYWPNYKDDPNLNYDQNKINFEKYKTKEKCSERKVDTFICNECDRNILESESYEIPDMYLETKKKHCKKCMNHCVNCTKKYGWLPISKCDVKFTGDLDTNRLLYAKYDEKKDKEDYYYIQKMCNVKYDIPESHKNIKIKIQSKTKIFEIEWKYLIYSSLPELFLDEEDDDEDNEEIIPLRDIPDDIMEIFLEFSKEYYENKFKIYTMKEINNLGENKFLEMFGDKYVEIMSKFDNREESFNSLYCTYYLFEKYMTYPFLYICMYKYKQATLNNPLFFNKFYLSCRFKNEIILNKHEIEIQNKIKSDLLKSKKDKNNIYNVETNDNITYIYTEEEYELIKFQITK